MDPPTSSGDACSTTFTIVETAHREDAFFAAGITNVNLTSLRHFNILSDGYVGNYNDFF